MVNLNSEALNISANHDINNNINNYSYFEKNMKERLYPKPQDNNDNSKIKGMNSTYNNNYFTNYNNNNLYNNFQKDMYRTNYMNNSRKYSGRLTQNTNNNNSCISYKDSNLFTSKSRESIKNKNKKSNRVNLDYINNLSKSKTEHNLIKEKTTPYLKEQEEISNYCTFKPKINKCPSFSVYYNMPSRKSIERLYLDSQTRITKKEFEALKKSNLESKENTFQPKFISSSIKKVKTDFNQRLKEFENIKRLNMQKLSNDLEDVRKLQFTFSPKINQKQNNKKNKNKSSFGDNSSINRSSIQNQSGYDKKKNIPVYKRLYNDNKDKKIRQEKRIEKEMEKIKKYSNSKNENIGFNVKKIEELYNDYKSKKNRIKKKQEEIEKEEGLTFKPELINQNKYLDKKIPGFYEREKIFLEKQQKAIDALKLSQKIKENRHKKKYTLEERKEIYSNIISRLYNDEMKKDKKNNEKIMEYKNNKIEFEKEPEEEVFNDIYQGINVNKVTNVNKTTNVNNINFFTVSGEKNINTNKLTLELTKSDSSN